jgi:hypothetical protein
MLPPCTIATHLVITCLHQSFDFIALVSIVINKVMDIEEKYSGWNHLEHTMLISRESYISPILPWTLIVIIEM